MLHGGGGKGGGVGGVCGGVCGGGVLCVCEGEALLRAPKVTLGAPTHNTIIPRQPG